MPSKHFERAFEALVAADWRGYAADARRYAAALEKAGCVYNGQVVRHLYRPTVYTVAERRAFEQVTADMDRLMREAIAAYKKDSAVRAAFGFAPLLEELILLDPGYDIPVPITRTDLFFQGPGDYMLCEINTDGTSGMLEAELLDSLALDCKWQEALEWPLEAKPLIDPYIDHLLAAYAKWSGGKAPERTAIVDFPSKTQEEFEAFGRAFAARGLTMEILSPDALVFDGRRLLGPSGPIDLVYRRLVTSDLMRQADRCRALIDAVLASAVCLVGGFHTQVPHNKKSFALYHDHRFRHHFSEHTRRVIDRHIPFTAFLDAQTAAQAVADKNRWVLKPADRYATKGVVIGLEVDDHAWAEAIEKALLAGDHLVQTFCAPPERLYPLCEECCLDQKAFRSMVGLFTYAGSFAGVLTRINDRAMIAGDHGGLETASLFEKEVPPDRG